MEVKKVELSALTVPSFRSILFERLAAHGIDREIGETVLEEITITTAIYMHKHRKLERAAIDAAKRMGHVVYLEPGAPTEPAQSSPAPKQRPPAVEL